MRTKTLFEASRKATRIKSSEPRIVELSWMFILCLVFIPVLIFLHFLFPGSVFLTLGLIVSLVALFFAAVFRKKLAAEYQKSAAAGGEMSDLKRTMEVEISKRTGEFTRANFMLQKEVVERKRIEEELKKNERRYRDLLQITPGWMYRVNAKGEYLEVIPGRRTLGKREEGQVVGKTIFDVLPQNAAKERMEYLKKALTTGAVQTYDKTHVANGQRMHFEVQIVPVRKYEALTIIRDITDRKRTEIALAESRQRYQSLVEHSPDAVIVFMDGVLAYANNSFLSLIGAESREMLMGEGLTDFIHPAYYELTKDYIEELKVDGSPSEIIESKIMRVDGGSVAVELMGAAISFHGKPALQLLVRDVSQRKLSQKERRRLEARIMDAQKFESLGVLAGGVAHDFNNLLTTILGYAGFARMEMQKSEDVSDYLAKIEQIAKRAAELCRQMLAYSGKGDYVVQNANLTTLIEDVSSLLHASVFKKVRLVFELDESIPDVIVDVTQIRQIVLNLVINASEAIGDAIGEVTVSSGATSCDFSRMKNVRFGANRPYGEYVFLEVADTGPGIAPETLDRIFDPFFTSKAQGRGLGLAAVASIVQKHGGAAQIETAIGEGAVFRIFFPAAQQPVVQIC